MRVPSPGVLARILVLAGAAVASIGVGLIYLPAGVIVAGVTLAAVGLLGIETGGGS